MSQLWQIKKFKPLRALDCLYCPLSVKTLYSFSAALLNSVPLVSSCVFMSHQFQPCTSSPLSSTCTSHVIKFLLLSLRFLGRMMMTRRVGAPGWPNFALTFSRNISTSAAWSGQTLVQKKCRHTLRKALLQAASREPECAGQLIQELQRATRSRARSELHTATCFLRTHLVLFSLFFWEDSQDTESGGHIILKYLSPVFWFCCSKFYSDGK